MHPICTHDTHNTADMLTYSEGWGYVNLHLNKMPHESEVQTNYAVLSIHLHQGWQYFTQTAKANT